MKKTYLKPQLAVENFSLSQTIASACGNVITGTGGQPNQSYVKACAFEYMSGITLFNDSGKGCTVDRLDYICYNNQEASGAVFYS